MSAVFSCFANIGSKTINESGCSLVKATTRNSGHVVGIAHENGGPNDEVVWDAA
jgi:hypothetical protein